MDNLNIPYFEHIHHFIEDNIFPTLESLNLPGLNYLTPSSLTIASCVIATVITICFLYTCLSCLCGCSRRDKKKNKTKVFGRVKDVTVHSGGGGGKKKSIWSDPFRPTNLDFQRRFEDEMTQFLYLLGVECVMQQPHQTVHVTFHDLDNKPSTDLQYFLDYRWLLKHYGTNFREYGHLFVKSNCSRTEIGRCVNLGWSIEEIFAELNANNEGSSNSAEVVVSWACQFRDLCHGLRDKLSKRVRNGGYLLEVMDENRMRENVMNVMGEGVLLVELVKAAISPLPKALKDHYHNIVSLQRIYRDEFIPFVSLSRNNKRKFDKIDSLSVVRENMLQNIEEILTKGGEDTLEVMATVVLPRFNCPIEQ